MSLTVFYGLFGIFGTMVIVFLLVDVLKYYEYVPSDERNGFKKDLAPRQVLRIAAIVISFLGATQRVGERTTAGCLLGLLIVYTVWTGVADSKTTQKKSIPAVAPSSVLAIAKWIFD